MLNRASLAAPLGVSVPTINSWLGILEITSEILLVPPFFENFGKRLVKSPKLHFIDSGLACHLLGIESEAALTSSTFLGPVFEGHVAAEIVKHQLSRGRSKRLYTFRDRQGLEVDFLVDLGDRRLALVEAKASRTPRPEDARAILRLDRAVEGYDVTRFVVHRAAKGGAAFDALAPGVRAVSVDRVGEIFDT
jgi:predicted AAA+ superfamily ATPase